MDSKGVFDVTTRMFSQTVRAKHTGAYQVFNFDERGENYFDIVLGTNQAGVNKDFFAHYLM